ncbi:hypothetical protein DXG03_003535, partial [Asterophora parasitica]
MLAVRPPPPHWRGRSRNVSQAALVRQASEERRNEKSEQSSTSIQTSNIHVKPTPPTPSIVSTEKPPFIAAPTPLHPPSRPTFMPSPSSSPPTPALTPSASLSPDYYDSPPSPPRSLEDQVHVAYALEDMHLAKVLLLRLKGITVTAPDDPRIAAVKDEDFDFCFVPNGRLMDEASEAALKDRQRRELEALEERRREERLRECERVWDMGKRRLREAKTAAASKRREEEQGRMRRQLRPEESRRPTKRPPVLAAPPRVAVTQPARVVAYKLVDSAATAPRDPQPFVYDFMPRHPLTSSRPSVKKTKTAPSHTKAKSPSPFSSRSRSRPLFDDTRTVPFSDVLTSMQGPLFPQEPRRISKLNREAELLNTLLRVVEWEEGERRKRKGKGKAAPRPLVRWQNSEKSCIACSTSSPSSSSCSVASTSSTSVSLAPSRRSWLSFSSASSSSSSSSSSTSVSTAATSPASSSWFSKSVSPTRQVRPKPWFLAQPAPQSSPPPPSAPIITTRSCTPCRCTGTHLTPVAPADSPLPLDPIQSPSTQPSPSAPSSPTSPTSFPTSITSPSITSPPTPTPPPLLPGLLHVRLTHLLDLAKGFQHAYMSATMFVVAPSSFPATTTAAALRAKLDARRSARRKPGRPQGQRAGREAVSVFLGLDLDSSEPTPSLRPIPLRTLRLDPDAAEEEYDPPPPRTTLPSPLPYKLHFKSHPPPCRPLRLSRLVHSPISSSSEFQFLPAPTSDTPMRAVENPLFLRVLAAANRASAYEAPAGDVGHDYGYGGETGGGKEEVVLIRDGALGSGRERVLRMAGVFGRRSALGIEVQRRR